MTEREMNRDFIARKIATYFSDGDVVNLGVGIPMQVANYLSKDVAAAMSRRSRILTLPAIPWSLSSVPAALVCAPPLV